MEGGVPRRALIRRYSPPTNTCAETNDLYDHTITHSRRSALSPSRACGQNLRTSQQPQHSSPGSNTLMEWPLCNSQSATQKLSTAGTHSTFVYCTERKKAKALASFWALFLPVQYRMLMYTVRYNAMKKGTRSRISYISPTSDTKFGSERANEPSHDKVLRCAAHNLKRKGAYSTRKGSSPAAPPPPTHCPFAPSPRARPARPSLFACKPQ